MISTDSAEQFEKSQAECPPHSLRLVSVSELMPGVKVDTLEEIMTQLDHFCYDVETFVDDITK